VCQYWHPQPVAFQSRLGWVDDAPAAERTGRTLHGDRGSSQVERSFVVRCVHAYARVYRHLPMCIHASWAPRTPRAGETNAGVRFAPGSALDARGRRAGGRVGTRERRPRGGVRLASRDETTARGNRSVLGSASNPPSWAQLPLRICSVPGGSSAPHSFLARMVRPS
jgi:hypothetical protein